MPELQILTGPDKGQKIEIDPNSTTVIGRDGKCDVTLLDLSASRMHCQISGSEGKFRAVDLNSSNGTRVNGREIDQATLAPGDVIEVGTTKLRFTAAKQAERTGAAKGKRKDPFIGKTIAGYKIIERLGENPLGTPYKAEHEMTGQMVMMKILSPMMANKDELVQRFIRQAKTGAEFKHPNVVQTLAATKEGELYFIVCEYVEGRSLQDMLDEQGENGTLDPALTLDIMLQIGHALEYAFEHQIVHRDIKPASIIVSDDGTAKLDNLWLAKHIDSMSTGPSLTGTGKTMGSLHYMAPEQIEDAKDVDCRADMYSLAATIYRALTGQVPCKGDSMKETLAKIRDEVPPSVRSFNKAIPPSVAKPIDRALSKNPDDRYQTPHDLVLELQLARKYQVR